MARTLEELNRTLTELGERQEKRRRLVERWSILWQEIKRGQKQAERLAWHLSRKQQELEELEELSLKALRLYLTGCREERLSQERAQAAALRVQYEQTVHSVENIRLHLAEVESELDRARDWSSEWEMALREKRALLCTDGGTDNEKMATWAEEQNWRQCRAEELHQLAAAGREAITYLRAADGCLGEAGGRGRVMADHALSSMMIHENIDRARDYMNRAKQVIQILCVTCSAGSKERLRRLAVFRTGFFDELLADLEVEGRMVSIPTSGFGAWAIADTTLRKQIEQSRDSVVEAIQEVERELSRLEELAREEDADIARVRAELACITQA